MTMSMSMEDDGVKHILAKTIHLADQVTTLAAGAQTCPQECAELNSKVERLAILLRQAVRAPELYERPARRILADTKQALDKSLSLASKCRPTGLMNRVFTLLTPAAFKKVSTHLDNSLADLSWLLRASDGVDLLGLPPIAQNEPILFLIWQHIATLHAAGSLDARSDSALALASLARDSARNGKLIVEEDGVGPLLRLVREGRTEGQEHAARAVGLLGRGDPESAEAVLHAGVCMAFAKALKDGSTRVQATVAWAIAELVTAAGHLSYQDLFVQNNIVRLLIGLLASGTVQENSKYSIVPSKAMSLHSLALAVRIKDHNNIKEGELEDSDNKAHMKAMAARALCQLAKGSPDICKQITDSKALLCFAILLEKGPTEEVRHNSALALMEIARVAEHSPDLRRLAFKPSLPAAKAVIDQLLLVVKQADREEDTDLLLPCVTALGCLSRMFRTTDAQVMVGPLVRLVDEREGAVARVAAVALAKFACTENHLHLNHSKEIIEAGGVEPLVQLVYLGKQMQMEALVLLGYIALHVPESERLAKAGALAVLSWASKQQQLVLEPRVDALLQQAKIRLELYQTERDSTRFQIYTV